MALQGALPAKCSEVFPFGIGVVSLVTALIDFDRSSKENKVQQLDKESGVPVWTVDVMDFDPEARERTFKVKIIAAVQPVPPDAIPGVPVRPVVLENLTITPYVKETGNGRARVAYSLRATGLAAPARVHAVGDASKAA